MHARRRRRWSSSMSACPTRVASRSSAGCARRATFRLFLTARSDEIDRVVGLGSRRRLRRQAVLAARAGRARARHPAPSRQVAPTAVRGSPRRRRSRAGRSSSTKVACRCAITDARSSSRATSSACSRRSRRASRPRLHARSAAQTVSGATTATSMDRTVDAHVKTLRAKMKAIAPGLGADPHLARQRLYVTPKTCRPSQVDEEEEMKRRLAFVVAVLSLVALGLAPPGARAQAAASDAAAAPPTYAVLSLIGDEFSVVMRRGETGTRVSPNERQSHPISGARVRKTATSAIQEAILRLRPTAQVLQFSIRDARLFALQEQLATDSAESRAMREALAKLLRENQVTQLVLVTKRRNDATLRACIRDDGRGQARRPGVLHRSGDAAAERRRRRVLERVLHLVCVHGRRAHQHRLRCTSCAPFPRSSRR